MVSLQHSWRFFLRACIATFTLTVLVGCGSVQPSQTSQTSSISQQTQSPQASIVLDLDVDRYEFNTPANMCHAPMISDVTVSSLGQSHWNTANKSVPSLLSQPSLSPRQMKQSLVQGSFQIYTPFHMAKINTVLDRRSSKGTPEEFAMMGGQQGTMSMQVGEYPRLEPAKRYLVVFVPALNATTKSLMYQWLLAYNAFPIDGTGMVSFQPKIVEHGKTEQQEVKVPLSQLLQQLAVKHPLSWFAGNSGRVRRRICAMLKGTTPTQHSPS
ncbi:hypothetical protein KSC_021540 [Ktedonobacter sp. SOSP1-52]|nr:hypothetical protein KSC_021540 [Ktedonobacter sp. SOSP1-52]